MLGDRYVEEYEMGEAETTYSFAYDEPFQPYQIIEEVKEGDAPPNLQSTICRISELINNMELDQADMILKKGY